MVINSVLGALITRPSSAASSAVLVSWDWARDIEDSRRTMSSAGHSAFWLDIFSTVEDRLPLHSQAQMPYPKGSQKEGGQNITLKNSCCYIKGFGDDSIHHYSAAGIAVKTFYGVDCNCSVDVIKGFIKIHKGNSKWELVFLETFHNSSQYVDLLCTASTWSKASLIFPQNRIYMWSNSIGPDRTFVNQERIPRS